MVKGPCMGKCTTVVEPEVREVMEMYKEIETSVKLKGEMSKWFEKKVEILLGTFVNPLLFEIVIGLHALIDGVVKTMKEFLYAYN